MNQGLSDVREKIKHISGRRREWDELFSDLQGLLKGKIGKLPVARVRIQFQQRVDKLKEAVRSHNEQLNQLKYRSQRLRSEGNDVDTHLRSLEALQGYFEELGKKVKEQQIKGEQEIAQRQRWEISQHEHEGLEEESQLIMSTNVARDARETAEMVEGSLLSQSGRLQSARQKMGSVLKNINLSGNIVNLLKKRSRQDNRLIMWLTLGLVLQIFLCLYYIRPLVKGY